jgi:tetratricopeptide (TPR) repeat protein
MHGPRYSYWLPAIALFVASSAASQAQLALNSPQPLAIDTATTQPLSSQRSGTLVNLPLPAPSPEQRGDVRLALKEYQAAVEAYVKVEQPSAAVWNKMGVSYQMLLDLKDAVRCYKESLKLDPSNFRVLNNLATVDDSLQDYSAAERLYTRALKINPRSALVLKNLGTNLLKQHQYGRGSDAYAQALAIDPHIFDNHFGPKVDAPSPAQERGTASYFEARSCARAGLTDCAIAHLRQAFNEGSATLKKVANENDFESMRGKPEFQSLLAEQK